MNAVASGSFISGAVTALAPGVKPERRQVGLFVLANGLLALGVAAAFAFNPDASPALSAYVLLLGLSCSAPLLLVKSLLGRATLLFIFQAAFFFFFALGDWVSLMTGTTAPREVDGGLTPGEVAILLTSLCFSVGYGLTAGFAPRGVRGWASQDWSPRTVAIMGVVFWVCGFILSIMFIEGNDFRHATSTGFAVFGGFAGVAVLFTYLQPVGLLCMIYLYLVKRSRFALMSLVVMFACEFTLGFLSSAKEFAFRGIVLFLIGVVFLRGRLPVRGLLVGLLAALLTFSFFQDMRTQVTRQGRIDLDTVVERLLSRPQSAFGDDNTLGTRFERGADYFASRGTLKGSVEMAVERTGVDVPYQNGQTLTPLLYAFVPRFWMPEKGELKLGLLFNKEFHISVVRTVYMAAGQNGELYWNFGWQGLVFGMLIMGLVMGVLNVVLDLKQVVTLPRFVLLMLAAYLLAFRFEAGIAEQYTLWVRALAMMFLIHALMPKARPADSVGMGGATHA